MGRKGEKERESERDRERRVRREGSASRQRTDAPRDKFMNFMGIWKAAERKRER